MPNPGRDWGRIIRERVSARQLGEAMGLSIDRQGYAPCPFHHEKTPSMKLWDGERGWHCYGCQLGGDVIDLAMRYYEITYQQAVIRLDGMFSLGLPLSRKMTAREIVEARAAEKKRALERKEARERQKRALEALWRAEDKYMELYRAIAETAPRTREEPWRPEFIKALKEITDAREEMAHWAVLAQERREAD